MRIRSLLALGLAAVLAGCAPRSVIAPQPMGEHECGRYEGWALLVNGTLWSTESDEEMAEWLSRIDSADVVSREELPQAHAAALFGTRGSSGGVTVVLRRGSPSEARFAVPPSPLNLRSYCPSPNHMRGPAPRDSAASDSVRTR